MDIPFIGNNWSDPSCIERNEIVFAHRKKDFGAYLLRREYAATLFISISITTLISVVLIACDIFLNHSDKKRDLLLPAEEINLAEPPSIDKTVPPPPPVIIPPPVQRMVTFTPPKIVNDEEVQDSPPTAEELQSAEISTVTTNVNFLETPSQQDSIAESSETDKVFTFVEEMPSFPGGENEMLSFIHSKIKYPDVARENNIYGKVYIKFMVDKEGHIVNPEILRGIGGGCDEEAMRVLNLMPDWIPGKQNGKKVKVGGVVLHVDFILR
jgi:protein TonB